MGSGELGNEREILSVTPPPPSPPHVAVGVYSL